VETLEWLLAAELRPLHRLCWRVFFYGCAIGQELCAICGGVGHLGDEVHYRGLRHEGFSWSDDAVHQVNLTSARHRIWVVGWQGRPECALCGLHGQCHQSVFRQVSAECFQDEGDTQRKCGGGRGCCLW
jgi:hypothetical protein